jgi:hypothetical protein
MSDQSSDDSDDLDPRPDLSLYAYWPPDEQPYAHLAVRPQTGDPVLRWKSGGDRVRIFALLDDQGTESSDFPDLKGDLDASGEKTIHIERDVIFRAVALKGGAQSMPVTVWVSVLTGPVGAGTVVYPTMLDLPNQGVGSNTDPMMAEPFEIPIQNDGDGRNPEYYDAVIDQFKVASNPRYVRSSGTSCNVFVDDVMRAMNARFPRVVDTASQDAADVEEKTTAPGAPAPKYPLVWKGLWDTPATSEELDANRMCDWMENHGSAHGWSKVSAESAQSHANGGKPAVVIWKNAGGIGHVAVVRPDHARTFDATTAGTAVIAQAGGTNFNSDKVSRGFGNNAVTYWIHD